MVLEVTDLSFRSPGGLLLCKDLNFSVNDGEIVHVQGDNGSGKTTLIRVLIGELRKESGDISYSGSLEESFFMPQMGNLTFLIPLTLFDVISMYTSVPQKEVELLGLLDSDQLARQWNTASGGEKQRALLSAVLLSKAKFKILDEPFNHLDSKSIEVLSKLINETAQSGSSFLIVSHKSVVQELSINHTVHLGGVGNA
jgi:zinc/manganese transport system ATP-binding protein/zinc transport system ATP-binding protein